MIFQYGMKILLKVLPIAIRNRIPDTIYLRMRYLANIGKKLDLKNPRTFNEKMQWLKLYDRRPEYTMMVDKHEVKNYISETIGAQYVIPALGVWDRFEDIDFDSLPDQFVLKCTHDSGGVVICRSKKSFDKAAAKQKICRCLKQNFYYKCREWPYKNVKPRVIAEQYMEDPATGELRDYKFMCFDGKVRCSFVCTDRYSAAGLHITFFDRQWNILPFERHYPARKDGIAKPERYEEMLQLAERLSEGIPFVRVDFYEVQGRIYFGELTFYPGSGFEEFTPEHWDTTLGSWIVLPDITDDK